MHGDCLEVIENLRSQLEKIQFEYSQMSLQNRTLENEINRLRVINIEQKQGQIQVKYISKE
jgi:hypothetical protein